ncbi:MAG TPA: signal peptidase II [Caulobacteraceae bacterium]|jgi:signal peptidase II|nr:signal peptidase II [Caulobacteraceae bacterium]
MTRTLSGYALALAVLIADQWSKAWILALPDGAAPALPGPVQLTLVHNTGISYGLLQGGGGFGRWGLAAFALAVAAGLAVWVARSTRLYTAIAVGLILGGALGNAADRILHGAVVDFIDVRALAFPWIFNIADSAISVGIVLLLAEGLFPQKASPDTSERPKR